MVGYMTCNSLACETSNFIIIDGGISECDEYSEIQCCLCEKTWKENSNGKDSEEHQFLR